VPKLSKRERERELRRAERHSGEAEPGTPEAKPTNPPPGSLCQRQRGEERALADEEGGEREGEFFTLLQFVCVKLALTLVRRTTQAGEWYFECPFCDKEKFHTLPHRQQYPDYWKCWGCNLGGDLWELVRNLRDLRCHPLCKGTWHDHQRLVAAWQKEYEAALASSSPSFPHTARAPSPLTLTQETETVEPYPIWVLGETLPEEDRRAVQRALYVEAAYAIDLHKLGRYLASRSLGPACPWSPPGPGNDVDINEAEMAVVEATRQRNEAIDKLNALRGFTDGTSTAGNGHRPATSNRQEAGRRPRA
jgi:hypothetical protein